MQKGRTGRFTTQNGELTKSTLAMIFGSKNFCLNGSWYWKNDIPRNLEDYHKVTNILKEREKLSTGSE